jgi:hypothetical protein
VGLSAGGVVASWAAQTRSDLDLAVPVAPGLGLKVIPTPVTTLAVNTVLALPDSYQWWDPLHKDSDPVSAPSPQGVQGYPRYSLHGLAQQLRLSFATRALAAQSAPAARSILMVTNGADLAVENSVADQLVATWRAHGATNVRTYTYPASLQLEHDLIDPAQSNQHVDEVYPKLIELINQ